ncbi:hypothetical protein PILCRDRAFT_814962 [Piloderma croceum F 1598]|uniref:Uncharacterized protein n=1 Tax=Piloderma croceum (strain F 1598) TaxID=765440 RepID=A0A0C3BLV4_PILCF|nr:hypothetical protein PILCRDRAFT_814962 [Piloderma croceum F 1598]
MGWQQDQKGSLFWSLGTYWNALYSYAPLWFAKNRPYPLLPEYSLAGRHVQCT